MNKKSGTSKTSADKLVKNIRRKTRQTCSFEEKTADASRPHVRRFSTSGAR